MKVFISAMIVVMIVLGLMLPRCFNGTRETVGETVVEKIVENAQENDGDDIKKISNFEIAEDPSLLNSGAWSAITLLAIKKKKVYVAYEHRLDPDISKNFGHGLYLVKDKLMGGVIIEKEIHLDSDDNIMIILDYRADEFYNCYDEDNKEICDAEALEVQKWKGIIEWNERIPRILKELENKK